MPGWTLLDTHPIQGRTFCRPLDVTETLFFWSSLRNGASDVLLRFELQLSSDARRFSDVEITKAWLSTKRRYPLSGATIRTLEDASAPLDGTVSDAAAPSFASEPYFVVRECDLAVVRHGLHEIIYGQVTSGKEVEKRVTEILDRPRPLSNELLVQLYVLRETRRSNALHLMILAAHCIMDVGAMCPFARCFLDTLARSEGLGSEPPQIPLVERLAMAISSEECEPIQLRSLSPARRRWRKTIGALICLSRSARLQGGHTLPCLSTPSTSHTITQTRDVCISFSSVETTAVLANCHSHNVTFGTAYPVLAQVAMTRVLCRRYLRGDISEEEWEYRKRQPYRVRSPVNLRPYLDRAWFQGGGGGECVLSVGMNHLELPFMTLGKMGRQYHPHGQAAILNLKDGAPPFSELLTFDRFLHRTGLLRKQMTEFFRHPLCFEILRATDRLRVLDIQPKALKRIKQDITSNENIAHGKPNDKFSGSTVVWAHAGSSFGNLDSTLPHKYPLASTHPLSPLSDVSHALKAGYAVSPQAPSPSLISACSSTRTGSEVNASPKMVLETTHTHLHVRPGQLYLGALTSGGQLKVFVYYDGNVFEEDVVGEWLDEFKGAVSWYLVRTHQSCVENHDGRARQPVFSNRVQANL